MCVVGGECVCWGGPVFPFYLFHSVFLLGNLPFFSFFFVFFGGGWMRQSVSQWSDIQGFSLEFFGTSCCTLVSLLYINVKIVRPSEPKLFFRPNGPNSVFRNHGPETLLDY